jgi:hypothetical protein
LEKAHKKKFKDRCFSAFSKSAKKNLKIGFWALLLKAQRGFKPKRYSLY